MKPSQPNPDCELRIAQLLNGTCAVSAFLSLVSVFVLVAYVESHQDSHRSSLSPWFFSVIFVPVILCGIRSLVRGGNRSLAWFTLVVGTGCLAYLAYLDCSGRMVSYFEMVERAHQG